MFHVDCLVAVCQPLIKLLLTYLLTDSDDVGLRYDTRLMASFHDNRGKRVPECLTDRGGGDNYGAIRCAALRQIVTTNKPTPSFLQAGCPSRCPTNSVKARKGYFRRFW